jgi:hypothetical protein
VGTERFTGKEGESLFYVNGFHSINVPSEWGLDLGLDLDNLEFLVKFPFN